MVVSSSPLETGRQLLRPRFIVAVAFVLSLSWIMFAHHEESGLPSFRMPTRQTRKTVAESLVLHEKIYQKSVKSRNERLVGFRKGESFNAWDGWMPWWWYFQAAFTCPHEIERIGSYSDGGKWVCGFSKLEEENEGRKCVVYSLGVFGDSSFETEVTARTNCEIWAYDASVSQMAGEAANNPRIHFNKVFIGDQDKVDENGAVWKTLKTIMKENGHEWIDILKMDIETSEYASLDAMMNGFEVLPFSQIQIELHLVDDKNPESFRKFLAWFERLEKFHLRPFWNEFNLVALLAHNLMTVCEFSFINLAGDHYLLRD
ncbi:hypothetical protein EMPS_08031 [Entomortierella parvispora]|uniref:Methyltransferase domain-containing protein n=1 Tax=Entomortierella parvispora TaxID=205924 RepID=A0A9P3HFM4_9FUNG|nr:hypothetical protein EMPS_08031 [Entomortierella parvispora]